jgi:hypothetical protein
MKLIAKSHAAFARADLVAMLAAAVVLACVGMGMTLRESSTRAVCFNNLRQVGQAVQLWGNDHSDEAPWLIPVSQGGTMPEGAAKSGSVWFEFMALSNTASNPRIFACPQDSQTRAVASNFGNGAGGLANSGFRANAVSYMLSFHSSAMLPKSVICSDRDVRPTTSGVTSCSRRVIATASVRDPSQTPVVWTNAVHPNAGHVLTMDGAVTYSDSASLGRRLVADENADNASVHLVGPR